MYLNTGMSLRFNLPQITSSKSFKTLHKHEYKQAYWLILLDIKHENHDMFDWD